MMMEQNPDRSNGTALQHDESPRQILGIPPIPVTKNPIERSCGGPAPFPLFLSPKCRFMLTSIVDTSPRSISFASMLLADRQPAVIHRP